jgi:hypothetical protein
MKKDWVNRWVWLTREQTRTDKAGLKILLAAILALLLFSFSESFAEEVGKDSVESKEKATQINSNYPKAVSNYFEATGKKEPLKPNPTVTTRDQKPTTEKNQVKSGEAQIKSSSTVYPKSYQLRRKVISSGSGKRSSTKYKLAGMVGEPVVGEGKSESFIMSSGFIKGLKITFPEEYLRGDPNGDRKITVSDVVYLINYLFKGGLPPLCLPPPFLACGDANCDGKVSVSDVVYLINYLFKGGPPPC